MPLPRFSQVSTPRTTLREVSGADLPDLLEINGDPEVTRYLPYVTWASDADATAWLERMQALGALLDHLFGAMGIRRVEAEVNPDNEASNALLRKLGFRHEGFLRQRWVAKGEAYGVNVYGLLADDRARGPDGEAG
jgi:RimJ/RimL family protein N-acetyltransferase